MDLRCSCQWISLLRHLKTPFKHIIKNQQWRCNCCSFIFFLHSVLLFKQCQHTRTSNYTPHPHILTVCVCASNCLFTLATSVCLCTPSGCYPINSRHYFSYTYLRRFSISFLFAKTELTRLYALTCRVCFFRCFSFASLCNFACSRLVYATNTITYTHTQQTSTGCHEQFNGKVQCAMHTSNKQSTHIEFVYVFHTRRSDNWRHLNRVFLCAFRFKAFAVCSPSLHLLLLACCCLPVGFCFDFICMATIIWQAKPSNYLKYTLHIVLQRFQLKQLIFDFSAIKAAFYFPEKMSHPVNF